MKKNKFVIYIVMFFAFFLIGNIKVKAAYYIGCEYTVAKNEINDTGVKFKQQEDFKVFLGFINGKLETSFYTQDDGDTYYEEEIEKYITIESLNSNYSCPKIEVKKTYRNGGWHALKGGKILSTDGERKIRFSGGTASCSYKSTADNEKKQKIDIDYDSKLSFTQIAASPKDISIFQRTDSTKTYEDSNATIIINFYTKLYNKCPEYLFVRDDGGFVVTTEPFKISGEKYILDKKSDECIMKDNVTYKLSKEYVDSIDTSKITQEKAWNYKRDYMIRYNDWQTLVTSNSIDTFKNCDYKEINDKYNEIFETLKKFGVITDEEEKDQETTNDKILTSNIINWEVDYGKDDGDMACEEIFDDEVMDFIRSVFTWIRIGVPILLIVLGVIDFSQVVISQDPDAMKKCTSKFVKRCIVAVIIFFLPTLILLILQWINDYVMSTNPDCVISNLSIIMKSIWK